MLYAPFTCLGLRAYRGSRTLVRQNFDWSRRRYGISKSNSKVLFAHVKPEHVTTHLVRNPGPVPCFQCAPMPLPEDVIQEVEGNMQEALERDRKDDGILEYTTMFENSHKIHAAEDQPISVRQSTNDVQIKLRPQLSVSGGIKDPSISDLPSDYRENPSSKRAHPPKPLTEDARVLDQLENHLEVKVTQKDTEKGKGHSQAQYYGTASTSLPVLEASTPESRPLHELAPVEEWLNQQRAQEENSRNQDRAGLEVLTTFSPNISTPDAPSQQSSRSTSNAPSPYDSTTYPGLPLRHPHPTPLPLSFLPRQSLSLFPTTPQHLRGYRVAKNSRPKKRTPGARGRAPPQLPTLEGSGSRSRDPTQDRARPVELQLQFQHQRPLQMVTVRSAAHPRVEALRGDDM